MIGSLQLEAPLEPSVPMLTARALPIPQPQYPILEPNEGLLVAGPFPVAGLTTHERHMTVTGPLEKRNEHNTFPSEL